MTYLPRYYVLRGYGGVEFIVRWCDRHLWDILSIIYVVFMVLLAYHSHRELVKMAYRQGYEAMSRKCEQIVRGR